jgi:hypothetical protein
MDADDIPIGHQLMAAILQRNPEQVAAILDAHEDLDLNALPGDALVYRPPGIMGVRVGSNSGSILHVVTSLSPPTHLEWGALGGLGEGEPRPPLKARMEAILTRLLQAGASPHSTDYSGYTPLHWACKLASDWAIRTLLAHGAPVHALDNNGSTPLHRLFRRHGGYCLGGDALNSLLEPMLAAGADPTVPRKLDGLRPYDLLSRAACYGPVAVLAVRDRAASLEAFAAAQLVSGCLIVPGLPPIAVPPNAGVFASEPVDIDDRAAADRDEFGVRMHGPKEAGRWRGHAAAVEERARRLDEQRRTYTRSMLQLLLWRQRAAAAAGGGGGHPVGALPEELLFAILLRACPDHGQRAELQLRFEAVAAHLAVANHFERRSAALAAWRASRRAEAADHEREEARLQQLGEEYDAATAKLKQLRALRSKDEHAHGKAVRAVGAFVQEAKGVLYGGLSSEGEDDSDGDMGFAEAE